MVSPAESAGEEEEAEEEALPGAGGGGGEVSTEEWQRWGTSAPLPNVVATVVRQLLDMEFAVGEKMRFGGVGSKMKVKNAFFSSLLSDLEVLLLLDCSTQHEMNRRYWQ
jgi:hypothetical protein